MAQQSGVPTTPSEDPGLVPSTYMVLTPSNYSSREPTLSSGPRGLLHLHDAHKLKQARTHIKIISQFSKGQGGLRPSRICEKESKILILEQALLMVGFLGKLVLELGGRTLTSYVYGPEFNS